MIGTGYYKDITGMIHNNNIDEYAALVERRETYKETQRLKDNIRSIESDLRDIKLLLAQLVKGECPNVN